MRFFTSIVLLVSSIVVLVIGIAQQTWLKPQPTVTESLALTGNSPAVVVGGDVLSSHDGPVTVTVRAPGEIAAGVAITSDVTAWLGDGVADVFSRDATSSVQARAVVGTAADVPTVAGSDLWTQQFTGSDDLSFKLTVIPDESLIISSGGGVVASSVTLLWAQDTSTPLAIPLLLIGGFALLAGATMLAFAIHYERRVVSPRRKSRRGAGSRGGSSRRAGTAVKRKRGRRAASLSVATSLAVTLALTGCVSDGALSSSSSSAAPEANTVVSESAPRLTTAQVNRIVADISKVASTADKERDSKLIATRFAGPALAIRLKNYVIRGKNAKVASPTTIPNVAPKVFLPQLDSAWPRQAFVLLDDEGAKEPPIALMLVQADARSNYVVQSEVELLSDITFPALPTAEAGGVSLASDTSLLSVAPAAIGTAYSDLIANGASSQYASLFTSTTDTFVTATQLHEASIAKDLGKQGTVKFSRTQDPQTAALSMSTADSGAIVAVFMLDVETSKPKSGYELTVSGEAKALLGKATTSKAVTTTYGDMLLFSVPPAGATTTGVSLLGFTSGLVDVKEGS